MTAVFTATRIDRPLPVRMTLCAPAGFSYWVLVDSGMARVVVGQVRLTRSGVTYRQKFLAPPLGGARESSPAPEPQSRRPSSRAASPGSDNTWHPPQSDGGWKPPRTGNGWKPPQSDNSWKAPQSDGGPP